MLSLVWFKTDLRVCDNPALIHAAELGRVLPVYIVDPEHWAQPGRSARQWAFAGDCITQLRRDLAELGQPLLIRVGPAAEVIARLHSKHGVSQILTNATPSDAWSHARDLHVAGWAARQGVGWRVCEATSDTPLPPPAALASVTDGSGTLPSARALGLPDDPCPYRQPGGSALAQQRLDRLCQTTGHLYRGPRNTALTAERAAPRLSADLAFGTLSPRQVSDAVLQARADHRGHSEWQAGLRHFAARFAAYPSGDDTTEEVPPLHATSSPLFDAWAQGCTGLPFVDAAMRYLRATGWVSAGLRGMLASVAGHLLDLPSAAAGAQMARLSTDYQPAIHWPQWRFHAQFSGPTRPRLVDPIALGKQHDPQGRFIRAWVPELAPVPDAFVHTPWLWPAARQVLSRRYPEPVVDPANALRAARDRSRGGASRQARPRPRHAAQLAFDFE